MTAIRTWTDAEDEILTLGMDCGLSYTAIGRQLGCSRNMVAGRAARLKLKTQSTLLEEPPRLTLADLGSEECCYPTATTGRQHWFCGKGVVAAGKPYCEEHMNRAYQEGTSQVYYACSAGGGIRTRTG